jgi:glycosyltransferase involved in cell wall biosynthesis
MSLTPRSAGLKPRPSISLLAVEKRRLRILFAAPAWAPSSAFGGPVVAAGELVRRLVARGHDIDVVTTTIVDLDHRPAARSSVAIVEGATVHYLATPVRYRWMGITPALPLALARLPRPDVVHVFGFRDPVTTTTATWCRVKRLPYVFEPLGMFQPRLRKVTLKRVLDATLYRGVARGAAAVVVASNRERDDVVACGVAPVKVHVRGNGFPNPEELGSDPGGVGPIRAQLGIPKGAPLILYVGRRAAGKGLEHLVEAAREIPEAHVVIAGPDDRHGVSVDGERVHTLAMTEEPPRALYPQADVFVLASAGESFGMVAAEAAAAGTPVIVSDRCGVAGFFAEGEALVVPYERRAVVDAIRRVLSDEELRERLSRGGPEAALRTSWDHVTDVQEAIYRELASRTAATNASTDAS